MLTQAAEVGGRWARWPPGGWREGAPQSQGGLIHNIWEKEDKKGRQTGQPRAGPGLQNQGGGQWEQADTQHMSPPTRTGGGMGPGLEDVNLLGAGLWEDAGLGGASRAQRRG